METEQMVPTADSRIAVVILAAGLGTRMKSDKAKVLHELAGRPMILYVVDTAWQTLADQVVLVVGHQADEVRRIVDPVHKAHYALQPQQLGTGHAVLCALPVIAGHIEEVVILCGDVPLLKASTVQKLIEDHRSQNRDLSVLGVHMENPTGYGRLISDDQGNVTAIVEEADADERQKRIQIVNAGIYCVRKDFLSRALVQIDDKNAQGEIYLTDIVAIGRREGRRVGTMVCSDVTEVVGVNSRDDLRRAELIMERSLG